MSKTLQVKELFNDYIVLVDEKGNTKKNFRDGLRDRVWKTKRGAENWAKNNGYIIK